MLSFEIDPDEAVTPTPVDDDGVDTTDEVTAVIATETDDEVTDAVTDVEPDPTRPSAVEESPAHAAARMLEAAAETADQLVADARATADEILEGLVEEKATVEAQIATLRQLLSRHSSQMRDLLTHQLSLLDSAAPDAVTS